MGLEAEFPQNGVVISLMTLRTRPHWLQTNERKRERESERERERERERACGRR